MTFKKILRCRRPGIPDPPEHGRASFVEGPLIFLLPFLVGLMVFATGCRDLPPLSKVELAGPGWTVRKAQAVWHPSHQAPEIVGEILVATRGDGSAFVHFSKPPFTMVIAQAATNRWQLDLPMQNRRDSGPGQPPARMLWFQLPLVISGRPPPKGWTWRRLEGNRWRLERLSTSEALEIYLAP